MKYLRYRCHFTPMQCVFTSVRRHITFTFPAKPQRCQCTVYCECQQELETRQTEHAIINWIATHYHMIHNKLNNWRSADSNTTTTTIQSVRYACLALVLVPAYHNVQELDIWSICHQKHCTSILGPPLLEQCTSIPGHPSMKFRIDLQGFWWLFDMDTLLAPVYTVTDS